MVKVNDIVRFLNQVGGGRVTRIDGNLAYVEDEDGFEQPVLTRECVVVEEHKAKPTAYDRPVMPTPSKEVPTPGVVAKKPEKVMETKDGNVLNVVLAFEPKEIKHLNTTTFYTYLVNDSNYYLYFSFMTRDDESGEWTVAHHELVEPNIQVMIGEYTHAQVNQLSRIAVQYIAFKDGKGFKLKNPAIVEHRVDVSKFYKLHSFHDNEYFESPVIAFNIVRNDVPAKQLVVDSGELERAMREKRESERPRHEAVKRHDHKKVNLNEIEVVDLHIHELLDNTNGLSNTDMLNVQLDKFREVMNAHIKQAGKRVVFIHGKGEGVLRKALLDELKRKYPKCEAQDASFREYGFGATQITIK